MPVVVSYPSLQLHTPFLSRAGARKPSELSPPFSILFSYVEKVPNPSVTLPPECYPTLNHANCFSSILAFHPVLRAFTAKECVPPPALRDTRGLLLPGRRARPRITSSAGAKGKCAKK